MNIWKTRILIATLITLFVTELSLATTMAQNGQQQTWNFRVMLDDQPIGSHKVRVDSSDGNIAVHTIANFDVRILFIPVYSYEHEAKENWNDGCIVAINTTTDDNGEKYYISSKKDTQSLSLNTHDGKSNLDGCVRTFAYWDVNLLKSDRLLNTQTGEYLPVSITDMGFRSLDIDGKEVRARSFRLVAEEMTIDLWYTKDMRWLALESITDTGSVLRYLPEKTAYF